MRRANALVIVVAALAIAGCGGGSENPRSEARSGTEPGHPKSMMPPKQASVATSTTPTQQPARRQSHPNHARPTSPATPTATVQAALASNRCDLYTARLVKKSYGSLKACESALKSGGQAKSVEILSTQNEGRFALVTAIPHGGPSSGEKLAISMSKENGDWRLDAIHSNAKVGP